MTTLSRLQKYMGPRKVLLPGSIVLSVLSTLLGMCPLLFTWLITKELLLTKGIVNQLVIEKFGWLAMGAAIGSIVLYFLSLTLSHLAAFRVETNLRRESMKKIVNLPLGFFDNTTSGKIRKIIDDNASITHSFLAHQLPDLAGSMLMPIVSIIFLVAFDWKLGLACLVPVLFSGGIMGHMMGGRGKEFMKSYMTSLENMNTEAVEYVRGIPVVKVFQQTVFSFKSFHRSISRYKDMVKNYTKLWEKPMSAYTVIIHGFAYVLAPTAILLINNGGDFRRVIINFIFYILLSPIFAQCIMRSMHINQALGQAKEAINRTDELVSFKPLVESSNPNKIIDHDIEFKDVIFSYPGADKNAIEGISFKLEKGKTFALVGASGSGKTTIARLVPRFWDVESGEVLIGGLNVKGIKQRDLMENVSFVFQNTKLLKMSLYENIIYGKPSASKEEVERAVDLAQCREFIERLPKGLETVIGSEGTYLSGGESQRVALARAILKDAPIVVLDEATAFADPENEDLIHEALGKLTHGKTVLMIAHRLTSVTDVDSILVIDSGKIQERGTHSELMDKSGIYWNMFKEYQKSVHWTLTKETV